MIDCYRCQVTDNNQPGHGLFVARIGALNARTTLAESVTWPIVAMHNAAFSLGRASLQRSKNCAAAKRAVGAARAATAPVRLRRNLQRRGNGQVCVRRDQPLRGRGSRRSYRASPRLLWERREPRPRQCVYGGTFSADAIGRPGFDATGRSVVAACAAPTGQARGFCGSGASRDRANAFTAEPSVPTQRPGPRPA
ncbi:hypothetical protein GLE_2763 [Lysobacter enzymogenes]|uniref:Uncharacterized protein n=1 Tax=Lysobacter enzymogenes TaxID=69 RepID=A0A0S2DIP1_LYSEN|nr:hypothetical protein GLE_2763 [Lysobacter enzymogenes]